MDKAYPEQLASPLFDSPIALSICPQCTPEPTPQLSPSASLFSYPSSSIEKADARATLPPCSSTDAVRGSYLPVHPLDAVRPLVPPPLSGTGFPTAGHYTFVPHGCRWAHAGLRFGDPWKCVESKKSVLVVGDSHGRVVADALGHRMAGRTSVLTESVGLSSRCSRVDGADAKRYYRRRRVIRSIR
jgi:hypothetical protein